VNKPQGVSNSSKNNAIVVAVIAARILRSSLTKCWWFSRYSVGLAATPPPGHDIVVTAVTGLIIYEERHPHSVYAVLTRNC